MIMPPADKPDLASLRIDREAAAPARPTRRFPWKVVIPVVLGGILVGWYVWFRAGAAVEVETAAVSLTSPSQANSVLTASGYVVAQRKAAVASKGAGRLVYLGVEEGDKVLAGQVIARLEDGDVVAALRKARADLEITRADSLDARSTLERQRVLMASSLTSQAELDAAAARFERVKATILSARAGVEAANVGVENTRIRAPFDGTVLTKNADVGEVVAPFASSASSRGAVVSMADMSSLQVEADVSESNITRVSAGQPCEIVLDAYPEQRYRGVVHKIVPTADRAKATVLTKVAFRERDDRVLPEMSAKVSFLTTELSASAAAAPPKLTVPVSALVERDGRQVVFIVREGVATETPVRTGDRLGTQMEIKEGLAAGDLVVNRPPAGFSSTTRVKTK
jgi:RND family efflux transporter MFP subunit